MSTVGGVGAGPAGVDATRGRWQVGVVLRSGGAAFLTALLVAVLGACGGGDEPAATPAPSRAPGATGSEPAEWVGAEPVEGRCRSRTPEQVSYEALRLERGLVSVDALLLEPGVASPEGAVVMLPQVSGGLCGGLALGEALAAQGVAVLAVDACGYDESTCDEDAGAYEQVEAGISELRERYGEVPVVAVGASMGGFLAVEAAADGADLTGWVDLSGPSVWEGRSLFDRAADVPGRGLVVHAPTDDERAYAQSRRLARRTGAQFLSARRGGHGWDTVAAVGGGVDRLGREVVAVVRGFLAEPR